MIPISNRSVVTQTVVILRLSDKDSQRISTSTSPKKVTADLGSYISSSSCVSGANP
jgi:hypothetical protein